MENGDKMLDGTFHRDTICPGKHDCCGWLILIIQTELDLLEQSGVDPMEYTQQDPLINKNFSHYFNGVEGPNWAKRWTRR